MSYENRPKPTYMLVCDLCDKEIERDQDGALGRGNLMCHVSPIVQVTNRTYHALLCWPRSRTRREEPAVSYDFHGGCIAGLVEEAIAAKIQPATIKEGAE